LRRFGFAVVPIGLDAVAFRFDANLPGRWFATDEEQAAAAAAMSTDRFWLLIALARRLGSTECHALTDRLRWILSHLSEAAILGFSLRFDERMAEAYRWDLWAVAYIVNGGCSDDGFEYFRGWLISQGKAYFEAAMRDPAAAADRASPFAFRTECEQMLYVALRAFEDKTGREGRELPTPRVPYARSPAGENWTEKQLPELYPELVERFSSRYLPGIEW
jgi:hypothetical protein